MMHNHDDVAVQNKIWTPRLIELTTIGNKFVANGKPQSVFVDPTTISLIYRGRGAWREPGEETEQPLIECTMVWLRGGGPSNVMVLEQPEEVAMRRDRALEIPVTLSEVKK